MSARGARSGDRAAGRPPCARPSSTRSATRHLRTHTRCRRFAASHRPAAWRWSCGGRRRTAAERARRTPAPPARTLATSLWCSLVQPRAAPGPSRIRTSRRTAYVGGALSGSRYAPTVTRPSIRLATVNIDCADAQAMADFYGRLLGWEITLRDDDFILMRDPAGGAG